MWKELKDYHKAHKKRRISDLFETPDRAKRFSIEFDGLLFDYSKTSIDTQSLWLLLKLVEENGIPAKRDAMFAGAAINETENRSVLHTALRNLDQRPVMVDDEDVMPYVMDTLQRMEEFAADVRDGSFQGAGGRITDVVNVGIGGSDLGPVMAALALAPYHDGPKCHFISNIDAADATDTLKGLDPTTTLVIVASKTFTTIETLTNAKTVRDWMQAKVAQPAEQFAALSSSITKTAEFGIDASRVFGFEDWVGGRYSVWGPIGLSLMIAIGPDAFRQFLKGAQAMDHHFQTAQEKRNLPIILALVGLWNHQVCGYPSRAVLPYDQRLARLPAYLQQLEMESNGKSVAMDGTPVSQPTGPIVWGEPGTNGQHAFYQLIHQGTGVVPCEFMIAARCHEPELQHHHDLLIANCLAQSEALMQGRSLATARKMMAQKGLDGDELERQARHRVFSGNRPSTTLAYEKLTPYVLGQILALYEHRVFVEGAILGINSFDQWGVELGKELATALQPMVEGTQSAAQKDGSTQRLLGFLTG
ncbi:glucose-6-phosphate isomerase [Algirhabdus cladophorae]|uniref:glucose-6-phosphate isomerase n=1 Tax=Algirhabdus cladophorae TaxID=3377108 RepID=UPI003B845BB3